MPQTFTYKLSVIIVNYNVEHFLDQCLQSVKRACEHVSTEVIIVDNDSVDGSLEMLAEKHSEFHLIANKDNVGFSKANNQAIREASGEYILLLNPDTVVAEDTFKKVIDFMDQTTDCGGLGVHMIDGLGNFLPESKRGLPKPMVAFYKIFGLSTLFPKSKRFGQYHMGHLDEFQTAEIDVLSGAFMLMRREALDKVGLLDEDYFMYGEDIDLSYRIQKGGYKNYYFPETSIIHYKGESTKKSSANYVVIFYRAMVIFAKKHFAGKNAFLVSFLINTAIYLRAFMALVSRFLRASFLPFIDLIYIAGGSFLLTNYWEKAEIKFPEELIKYSIPIYALIWIFSSFINGGYDRPIKILNYLKGVAIGTIVILVAYAILPKAYQFSRLFIFAGAGWSLIYYFISRLFLHFAVGGRFKLFRRRRKDFQVIANDIEFNRINELLKQTQSSVGNVVQFDPATNEFKEDGEVIFSAKDMSHAEIIASMISNGNDSREFKIVQPDAEYVIGSNSIDTAGDLYLIE